MPMHDAAPWQIFNEDMPSVLFTLTEAPVAGLVLLVLALI